MCTRPPAPAPSTSLVAAQKMSPRGRRRPTRAWSSGSCHSRAEVLARIQHPQVVQVFEVDTYQGPNGVPIPATWRWNCSKGGSLSLGEVAGRAPGLRPPRPGGRRAGRGRTGRGAGAGRPRRPPAGRRHPPRPETGEHSVPGRRSARSKVVKSKAPAVTTLRLYDLAACDRKYWTSASRRFTRVVGADLTQSGQVIEDAAVPWRRNRPPGGRTSARQRTCTRWARSCSSASPGARRSPAPIR